MPEPRRPKGGHFGTQKSSKISKISTLEPVFVSKQSFYEKNFILIASDVPWRAKIIKKHWFFRTDPKIDFFSKKWDTESEKWKICLKMTSKRPPKPLKIHSKAHQKPNLKERSFLKRVWEEVATFSTIAREWIWPGKEGIWEVGTTTFQHAVNLSGKGRRIYG